MTDTRGFAHGDGPGHGPGPWSGQAPAPGQPFVYVPPPRVGEGLPYGYTASPGPHPTGWGPPPPPAQHSFAEPVHPGQSPPASPRPRRRTVLVAVLLAVVLVGGLTAMVARGTDGLSYNAPAAPVAGPEPGAPPAPSALPSTHYTLDTMFGGNGTCSPATDLPVSVTGGLACGQGDGTAFVFYQYSGTAIQNRLVSGWGTPGLALHSEDDCRATYTGSLDIPGVGPSPVVIDVYKRSPFMAATTSSNGRTVDELLTPQYQVADRGDLCAGR